jgi:hypothetical protein
MWILEANARDYGWSISDLLEKFNRRGYSFMRIALAWGKAKTISSPAEVEYGDNLLCYVPEIHCDRIKRVYYRV